MNISKKVLKTTKYVADNSQDVKIDRQVIEELAKKWSKRKFKFSWPNGCHYSGSEEQTTQYVLILDSLNFNFFSDKGQTKWHLKKGQKQLGGYFSLAYALKKAIDKYPILDATYMAKIPLADLKDILKGQGTIPLLKRRHQILRDTGKTLLAKYDGQAANLIKAANHSGQRLIKLTVDNFSSFKDVAEYRGEVISIYKRAQILVADLYGSLRGQGLGKFNDLDKLTAFADYKLPQLLLAHKIFQYAPTLLNKIKKQQFLAAGSEPEVELRAATIWAVEYLKQALAKNGQNLKSFEVDWILWSMSQKIQLTVPHHQTRTIYY